MTPGSNFLSSKAASKVPFAPEHRAERGVRSGQADRRTTNVRREMMGSSWDFPSMRIFACKGITLRARPIRPGLVMHQARTWVHRRAGSRPIVCCHHFPPSLHLITPSGSGCRRTLAGPHRVCLGISSTLNPSGSKLSYRHDCKIPHRANCRRARLDQFTL